MKLLKWAIGRWVLGVGMSAQLIFSTQWVSAANVSELDIAPNYWKSHQKAQNKKNISKPRKNFILLSENTETDGKGSHSVDVPGPEWAEPEASLENEEIIDPFDSDVPALPDPFEKHNRFFFDFNNKVYNYFTKHVAEGYRFAFPLELRIAIRNVFNNGAMPISLVSSLIQGNFEKSGRVVGRFLINSTAGLGGMLDVAEQEYNIKPVHENMNQALGFHDIPSGPYLVLPLFGPSSVRNLFGRTADIFVSPAFLFSAPFMVNSGIATGKKVNETSFLVKTKKELEQNSLDEYESVRDFYNQYHYRLIRE